MDEESMMAWSASPAEASGSARQGGVPREGGQGLIRPTGSLSCVSGGHSRSIIHVMALGSGLAMLHRGF